MLSCKASVTANHRLLQSFPIPQTPWSTISMDFIDYLPQSNGKDSIWKIVDRLTKFVHFIALAHPFPAQTLTKQFMDFVLKLHGLPETIVSDHDSIFISLFWHELFKLQGMKLDTSNVYHT